MFVKESKGGGGHAAFVSAYAMFSLDKDQIPGYVCLRNALGRYIVVVRQQELHFLDIVAYGTLGVVLGMKHIIKLLDKLSCFIIEGDAP